MKIWLSKNVEIPLRDQLTRQIMLAISSGDLQTGDKLPSVREIALRFKVHQNTVSTAYQWLEENGWVESRKGSGVFVTNAKRTIISQPENELETLIIQLFYKAAQIGYSNEQILSGVQKYLSTPNLKRILLVESNPDLQEILLTELKEVINSEINTITLEDFTKTENRPESIVAAMPKIAAELSMILPKESTFLPLKVNSVQLGIKGQRKPENNELIGIVSGWESFQRWAKTFLLAVGIENDSLLIRNPNEPDFIKGLDSCSFIIADSVSATKLPRSADIRLFKLIAEDSIEQLKNLIR